VGRIESTPGGYSFGRHWHLHCEILYVSDGTLELVLSSGPKLLNQGDLVVLYPGAVHAVTVRSGPPSGHFVVGFDPELFDPVPSLAFNLGHVLPYVVADGCSPPVSAREAAPWLAELHREYAAKTPGYELAVCSGLFRLAHWIHNRFPNVFSAPPAVQTGPDRVAIWQVVTWLATHFTEEISATQAAARAGMSYSYFAASFKKVMHCPFKTYLLLLRIRESERLLLDPDLAISEIAVRVGFQDVSYFIKQFRLQKGLSPRKYRQQQRESAL
jgi:AraC-like DNA-binding protein